MSRVATSWAVCCGGCWFCCPCVFSRAACVPQGHANGTCTVWALVLGVREDAPFELNRVSATPQPVMDSAVAPDTTSEVRELCHVPYDVCAVSSSNLVYDAGDVPLLLAVSR